MKPVRYTVRAALRRPGPLATAVALVVAAVIGAAAVSIAASAQTPTWSAQRQVLVRVWSIDSLLVSGQAAETTPADLADAATVLTSADVLGPVADLLSETGVTSASLAREVTATPSASSDFVTLSVTGPSAAEADRRADLVAQSFDAVVRRKVLASAAQVLGTDSADDKQDGPGTGPQIRMRARAVGSLDPVQVYRTEAPQRTGISRLVAIAVGAVLGLALAALVVVLTALRAPRLRRAEEASTEIGVPALSWPDRSGPTSALAEELLRIASRGTVVVCAARAKDAGVADRVAAWLSAPVAARMPRWDEDQGVGSPGTVRSELLETAAVAVSRNGSNGAHVVLANDGTGDAGPLASGSVGSGASGASGERDARDGWDGWDGWGGPGATHGRAGSRQPGQPSRSVVVVDSPDQGLARSRPASEDVDLVLLVASVGVPTSVVVRAAERLATWHVVDAVALVD